MIIDWEIVITGRFNFTGTIMSLTKIDVIESIYEKFGIPKKTASVSGKVALYRIITQLVPSWLGFAVALRSTMSVSMESRFDSDFRTDSMSDASLDRLSSSSSTSLSTMAGRSPFRS